MEINNQPPHLTSLHVDRNALLSQMIRLQNQIVICDSRLVELVLSKQYRSSPKDTKALKDEIFGCRIEVQSLHVRINRLKAKMSSL